MEIFEKWLGEVSNVVWGPPMLFLLFGTHLFLTFRLGFIQRYLGTAIKISFSRRKEGEGDVSQFGALMTALAATIGTGNIIGVATAVSLGGPGAVLWMWLTGVFGIATKYSEALLSVKYRIIAKNGTMSGGPMYVLERGMNCKWLGMVFAGLTAFAAFGIGNMVQANSIATLISETHPLDIPFGDFVIPSIWTTGAIITFLTAIVILGGVKSIANACEKLVPFMAIFYVGGCLYLLYTKMGTLPQTFQLIINGAFNGQAAVGGFAGVAMKEAIRYGIARGLFSNESGLGSAPIVAAAAQTKNPVRQALVSSTGTFWDTVVVCAMTGLVLVNSGVWIEGLGPAQLTREAFSQIPGVGMWILNIGLLTFVYSTILGWSYYGEKAAEYLWGVKVITLYRWLWVIAVMVGSVVKLQIVWDFADIANALMAIPNLISLLALNGVIVKETREFLWNKKIV